MFNFVTRGWFFGDCSYILSFYKWFFTSVNPTIERQSKHNHQCEQGERKKPSIGLSENWQAVDGLFVVLSAGEFESCVSPKTPKSGEFASPVRYFYFRPPWFFKCEKIVLNCFEFFDFICKNPAPKCGVLPASFLSMQVGGDGGIRTHEPLRTTWFRVRLVMTTSIRLHSIIIQF